MSLLRIPFPLIAIFILPAWLSGCFTEVGNAEDDKVVSSEFKIDYSANPQPLPKAGTNPLDPDSIFIRQFYLNIREAEFKALDSVSSKTVEKHLWKSDTSTLPVDFTGRDTAAVLPSQNVGAFNPDNLVLQCLIPKRAVMKPDTLDFSRFADQGYIKGTLGVGKSAMAFLFLLPQTREIHLEYSKVALGQWYRNNEYHCEFVFFATKWVEGLDLTKAESVRDKTGLPVVIFDGGHNAVLYQSLVDRFYKSFNTARVFADVGG